MKSIKGINLLVKSGKALFIKGFFIIPFFSFNVSAQDFHLSQYDAAPLFLNPAMAGLFNGGHRIHAHYRSQWSSISSKPFQTAVISYDRQIKKFGLGIEVLDNRAGAANYNVFSSLLCASFDLTLDRQAKHHISFGVKGGVIQKSVNEQRLYFNNQYSPINGGSFDPSLPSGEILSQANMLLPDISAGLVYYFASEQSRVNPYIGVSTFHLSQPNETFFDFTNKLPLRYAIHGGCQLAISEKVQLSPKFLLMQQTNARNIMGGLLLYYYLEGSDAYLIFGPTARYNDAGIVELGLKTNRAIYKVSYDVNVSALNPATNGRGGFEVSITYIAKKPRPQGIKICPRL